MMLSLPDYNNFVWGIGIHDDDDDLIFVGGSHISWNPDVDQPHGLLRTRDNGATWVDLTPQLRNLTTGTGPQPMAYFGISDVIVDPDVPADQPATVYVSFDGFAHDYTRRVYKSVDDGESWTDISNGLPIFPVNDLELQKGSGGILYAATDAGIYVYDPQLEEWNCFSEALPICIATEVKANICTGKLYASTFGRGIWVTDVYKPQRISELIITSNTTISGIEVGRSNIVVEPGATLTVTGELRMYKHRKIIVKQNARLIVDGGTITAQCGDFWTGIEVWGTASQHQFPAIHPTYQGLVVLRNGSVIEHARNAITNWKPGDWNSMGGAIQVQGTLNQTGATFKNCRRAVEFMQYRNFSPNSPTTTLNNISYFRHADFILNPDYRGLNDLDAQVTMWSVTGISFTQCDFLNQLVPQADQFDQSHWLGGGIHALDAGFTVNGQCAIALPLCEYGSGQPEAVCPDEHQRPSRFIGFDHGIRAVNSGTKGRTYSVRNSYFEDNVCGIYTDAVRNATILRNEFVVGGRDVMLTLLDEPFMDSHRGVYMYYANGFRVEENRLLPTNNAPIASMEGVVVGYSGPYNDQVYKNEASGVDIGFAAEDVCVDLTNPTAIGLSFFCNDNLQNLEEDLKVRTTLSGPPPADHCIKMFQGSVGTSAGNTFTPWQNGSSPYYNFHNQAQALPITYFWEAPPGDLNNGAYNAPWVQRNVDISTNEHGCPTRITCGGTPQVKAVLDPLIQQEKMAYLNLKYVFESLLDGGDFEGLKETIMESWPQDAWDLRNALMARSPYLSVKILKDAGLRNILPHAMYLEICLANPEATQQDRFVHWVQYSLPNPLPEYMVAQIVASWDQRTWRSNLESAMAWHLGEFQQLNDRVMSIMLNDSTPPPVDSLLVRWRVNPSLRARYGEVGILLEMEDFEAAENLLNGLQEDYSMDQIAKEERDDMLALINVVRDAHVGGRTIMQLDNEEVGTLESIAARQPSIGASHARNILCFGYGICTPPITGEASQPKSQWTSPPVVEELVQVVLSIHPNPANSWVAISHEIGTAVDRAAIRIIDPQGKQVHSESVVSSPGQLVWDTRNLAAGTYTVELHNKGQLVEAQRLVILP